MGDPLKFLDTMSHDLAMQAVEDLDAARREGVIEGLERALEMTCFHHGYVSKSDIRAEIERLRGEKL